jgi:hypothetical protein
MNPREPQIFEAIDIEPIRTYPVNKPVNNGIR